MGNANQGHIGGVWVQPTIGLYVPQE